MSEREAQDIFRSHASNEENEPAMGEEEAQRMFGALTPDPIAQVQAPRGGSGAEESEPDSPPSEIQDQGSESEGDQGDGEPQIIRGGSPVHPFLPPDNAASGPVPFEHPEEAFSDENFSLIIRRVSHRQEKRFRLHDMLLNLEVVRKHPKKKAPLLISMLLSIQTAIAFMLRRLQEYFSHQSRHQVYLVVLRDGILNGLQTGNLSLHDNSAVSMAKLVVKRLYNYLKSKVTLRWDKSFKIVCKVLSVPHMQARPRRPRDVHIYGASSFDPKYPSYIFPTPKGTPDQPYCFKNSCLLVASLIAYFHCLLHEGIDVVTYSRLTFILDKKHPRIQRDGAGTLQLCLLWLHENLPQIKGQDGPLKESFIPILADFFKSQITIFSSVSGKKIYSFPPEFDETRRQMYLLAYNLDYPTLHVHAIRNVKAFFRKMGHHCFFCSKTTYSNSHQHFCTAVKKRLCFLCRRPKAELETYITEVNKAFFCNSKTHTKCLKEKFKKCKCNLTFRTIDCKTFHKKMVCRKLFFCEKCNTCISTSKTLTQSHLQKSHVCYTTACRWCRALIKKGLNHLCTMTRVNYQKYHDAIGILAVEVISHSPHNCKSCYEDLNLCTKTEKDEPNLCVLLLEKVEQNMRGIFDRYVFAPEKMGPLSEVKENCYFFENRPVILQEKMDARQEKKVPCRKKMMCQNYIQHFSQKRSSLNVIESLILTLIKKSVQTASGITVLVFNGQHVELHFIMEACLSNSITPTVFKKDQGLISVEIPHTKIRFCNADNYFECSLDSLRLKFQMRPYYFPTVLNHESMYSSSLRPPDEDSYFCFSDDEQTIKEKKAWIKEMKKSQKVWLFNEELIQATVQRAKVMLVAVTDFVAKSFRLQEKLNHIQTDQNDLPNDAELDFIHPFSRPLCTNAGYSYYLFLLKMRKTMSSEVNVVPRPETGFFQRISQEESEWTSYLIHSYGFSLSDVCTAFSRPEGQKKVAGIYPDIVTPLFMGWFHGCYYHGCECLSLKSKEEEEKAKQRQLDF